VSACLNVATLAYDRNTDFQKPVASLLMKFDSESNNPVAGVWAECSIAKTAKNKS